MTRTLSKREALRPSGAKRFYRYFLYVSGLALLGALIAHYGPQLILGQIRAASVGWVLFAGVCIAGAGLLGAVNAFLLIAHGQRLRLADFLPLFWTSWAVGLLVPGQVGDVASIGLLMRRNSLSLAQAWGRAALDKAVSLVVMLGFAAAGCMLFIQGLESAPLWSMAFTLAFASAGALMYFANRRWRVLDASKPGMRGALARMGGEFLRMAAHAPQRVLLNLILTTIKVVVTGIAYWAMFYALGAAEVPLPKVVILATTAGLVSYLPISINGLGTVEAAGVFLFGQLGVGASTVISAYLLLRLLVYIAAWGPTFAWWLFGSGRTGH